MELKFNLRPIRGICEKDLTRITQMIADRNELGLFINFNTLYPKTNRICTIFFVSYYKYFNRLKMEEKNGKYIHKPKGIKKNNP